MKQLYGLYRPDEGRILFDGEEKSIHSPSDAIDLDISATEYIHDLLIGQRDTGTATLLISEDLDEIMALSDRIAVIFQGEIMGIIEREDAVPEEIGLMMAGEEAAQSVSIRDDQI